MGVGWLSGRSQMKILHCPVCDAKTPHERRRVVGLRDLHRLNRYACERCRNKETAKIHAVKRRRGLTPRSIIDLW